MRCVAVIALIAIAAPVASPALAQDWVEPLSRLSPPDWSLVPGEQSPRGDSLEERIAIARQLGRFGPALDAEALLLEALQSEGDPALRDEVLRSLARRRTAAAVGPAVAILEASESPVAAAFLVLAAVADRPAVAAAVAQLRRPAMAGQARWALLRIGDVALFPLIGALQPPQHAPGAAAGKAATGAGAVAQVLGELGDGRAGAALLHYLERSMAARDEAQQVSALGALGRLGQLGALGRGGAAPRAKVAAAAARLLGDRSAALRNAALACLTHVATPTELPALIALVSRGQLATRGAALVAIASADPLSAVPHLRAALASEDREVSRGALEVIVARPQVAWVPLLREQLATTRLERAASALSRIADGRGLPALLEAAAAMPDRSALLARAVALALRRHATSLGDAERGAALELLRALAPGPRRLQLRALARDPALASEVGSALRDADPGMRAAAGLAAEYLAQPALSGPLLDALDQEVDAEAFRRMADAALRLQADVEPASLWRHLQREQTAPEALLLLGAAVARVPDTPLARTLRRLLRRSLRNDGRTAPRTRAAAALGLSLAGDPTAHTALLAALDDPDDRIRSSAARALGLLGGEALAAQLAAYARVERSPAVYQVLCDAIKRASSGARAAERLAGGPELLEVRVGGQMPSGGEALLDVATADGRWRRLRANAQGELILTDLAPGEAEVTRVE